MSTVPRPPLGPNDGQPPPSPESMQGVLGPFAPTPKPTPFDLPVAPVKRPDLTQGPIGRLPDVTNAIDVAPPPTPKAAPVPVPMANTPQLIPGYGPAPGAPKPPVPAGLQPNATPPESVNPELTTGTGVPAESFANSGILADQQAAYESFMKRWALPKLNRPAPIDPNAPPTPDQVTAAHGMEGAAGMGLSEEQISNLAKGVAAQQGAQRELYTAIADAAIGLASPESIATIATAELGGAGIQAIANSPRAVALISKLPGAANIRKAVDIAARNAVPAAFTAAAGKQSVQAAQAGEPVDAAVNALIAVAGMLGIHTDVKAVGATHPIAPTAEGAYAGPVAGKRGAQATAEALETQGQGLAAQSWRDVAAQVQTENKPVTFKAGDQNLRLKPVGKLKGREFFTLVDETGKELSGGTLPTVQAWMGMNLPEAKVPGPESGTRATITGGQASVAAAPTVPGGIAAPARPLREIFRDADALDAKIREIAASRGSFGNSTIQKATGQNYGDIAAALDRLTAAGTLKRAQNKTGGVVYHAVNPSSPTAAAPVTPAAPTAAPVSQPTPTHPSDIDALLDQGGDTTTIDVGGQKYTVTRQVVRSTDSSKRGSATGPGVNRTDYTVKDQNGDIVAQAGLRKPTVEKWLAAQIAKATTTSNSPAEPVNNNGQPEAPSTIIDKTADNQLSAKPGQLPVAPSVEATSTEAKSSNIIDNQPPTSTIVDHPEAEPPSFEEFVSHPEDRKFSSTQVELPAKLDRYFQDATAGIPDSDLAEDGREVSPHVTVKYGLHDEEPAAVKQLLADQGPITDDGQYIIGAKIDTSAISRVLRGLGAESNVKLSPEDVTKVVMVDGDTLDLAGDMKLRRVRLSGETRMELLGVPYNQEKTIQSLGVSKEYIQHRQRYFVDTHDADALPAILAKYPVVGSSTGADVSTPGRIAEPGMFGSERGSLRIGEMFHPVEWGRPDLPAGPPASKSQRRKIKRLTREIDLPDATLARVLKNDYGIDSLEKLDRNQFTDLAAKLAERMPNGIHLREPGAKPWDKWIASPSIVLPRSRAGGLIWRAAQTQYWRQKGLDELYIRNYHKATKGLSLEDKERIKLFRYVKQVLAADEGETGRAEALLHAAGEDPNAVDTIDQDFLSAKQKAANDKLTKLVFNPIWQQSVKEGLVPEDRYIDDYLTFYRDDLNQSPRSRDRRDRAALIAQETGMRLDVADKILSMANAKKVTFGPFDFRRGKFSLPGLLSLDDIANVYIRGFGRKSAHTAFLNTANKLRPKIKNPDLREYARHYINQYVGVPQHNIFDDWINRQIQGNKLVKRIVGNREVSLEQLAMAATATQYLAKIGLNLYTPLQNLTQATNTLAKAGVYKTSLGAFKYLAARMAPYASRAWAEDLVRLRKSGVLDSMANKIERPEISGLPGKAAAALTYFFDQSEQFNRGAAFFAGYLQAKAHGVEEGKAIQAGRDMVRMTQFMSGRLDAPLSSRTPTGRVLYQFKVFSLKSWEMFWNHMDRAERTKLMLWSVAVGGPTAMGVSYLMHTFMPSSPYTEKLDEFQETANLAAFLQIPRMAQAVGIWQVPLADQFSTFQQDYGRWWEQSAKWLAGPTINAIADTVYDSVKLAAAGAGDNGDAQEKAWKFTFDLLRNWVPGGVTLRRLGQAMKEGDNTEDQLKILFAAYDRDNPGKLGTIQDLSRKIGIEKLIPDVLPDSAEVK